MSVCYLTYVVLTVAKNLSAWPFLGGTLCIQLLVVLVVQGKNGNVLNYSLGPYALASPKLCGVYGLIYNYKGRLFQFSEFSLGHVDVCGAIAIALQLKEK